MLPVAVCAAIGVLALSLTTPAQAQQSDRSGWSGPYAGIALGYSSGDDEAREINGPRVYIPTFSGITGAAYLGWQKQFDRVVVGVEAEGGYIDGRASMTRDVIGGSITSGAMLGAYGSLSGRFGYLVHPNWMLFGKSGLVIGELNGKTVQTCSGPDRCAGAQSTAVSSAPTKSPSRGYLLGAGVEHRINDKLSANIAYQFTGFRKELALPEIDGPGWNHDVDVHAIRLGLSFKF
jgi:outer membrane immunogenic protein